MVANCCANHWAMMTVWLMAVYLISRRTSELLCLFSSHSRGHVWLLDLHITSQLIRLEGSHVSLSKGDCIFDPMPELDVVEVVEEVAEHQLDLLMDLHAQDPFPVLILAGWSRKQWAFSLWPFNHLARLNHGCCIFWPAFGCCTLHMLVEKCSFPFFTWKCLKGRKKKAKWGQQRGILKAPPANPRTNIYR